MNKKITLAKRPVGLPEADTWNLSKEPIPQAKDGEAILKTSHISLDPAMRGWINDTRSYIPPVQIGEVMRAGTVGQVIESKNPDIKVGDYYTGWGGVQQYCVIADKGWHQVDPNLAPLPTYIGTLGMPGMTAYFGLMDVGQPKEGETILVSGAAGAVGSIVGQIGKIKGCRVVGIAGGKDKCDHVVNELGFDACIDYKTEDVRKGIKQHCLDGVDIYFDNVGGHILDAALTRINRGARIPICGAISQYNATAPKGPVNYLALLVNRARMEGFVVLDYAKDFKKAAMEMGGWMMQGKLKSREHIEEGIENFHETFLRLFSGEKLGKLVLKVD
ncbi:MAG: NADP-dependent oxidoreductase [Bacteroidota bacterium]